MFVILWEYEVKPGSSVEFQRAYGSAGPWALLFERDPHYRGTQLLHVPSRQLSFLTLDYWDTENDYRNFLTAHAAAYEELDRQCGDLTLRECRLASFTL